MKEARHKRPVLNDPFIGNVQNRQIHRDRNRGCRGRGGRDKEWLLMSRGFLFGVTKIFWNSIVVMIAQFCEPTKNH